jgi:integrase
MRASAPTRSTRSASNTSPKNNCPLPDPRILVDTSEPKCVCQCGLKRTLTEFVIGEKVLDKMLKHEKCTPVLKDLIPFLIDTGLRLGEAMSLGWMSVDIKHDPGSVFVERGKTKNARCRLREILLSRKTARSLFLSRRVEPVELQAHPHVSWAVSGLALQPHRWLGP